MRATARPASAVSIDCGTLYYRCTLFCSIKEVWLARYRRTKVHEIGDDECSFTGGSCFLMDIYPPSRVLFQNWHRTDDCVCCRPLPDTSSQPPPSRKGVWTLNPCVCDRLLSRLLTHITQPRTLLKIGTRTVFIRSLIFWAEIGGRKVRNRDLLRIYSYCSGT